MNTTRWICALAIWSAPVLAVEQTPITVEQTWALARLAAPAISPDGRYAVSAITRFNVEEDKGLADLWLFATDGSEQRQLTSHVSNESNPLFSPDGRWIAFVAQRDPDTAPQLYLLPLAGGEARRLTNVPTGVSAPKWYGDSKALAYISRVWPELDAKAAGEKLKQRSDSKMTARVWEASPVTAWDQFVDERQAHLFRIGIDGGDAQPLTLASGLELPRSFADAGSYDIDPASGRIAFVADSDAADNRVNLDVYLLDQANGSARNLTPTNPATDTAPRFSPDGKTLAIARQSIVGFYGDTRKLVLIDLARGNERVLHGDWDRSADGLVWHPDGRRLYGAIDDAGTIRAYELPLQGTPRAITSGPSVSALALSSGRSPVLVGLRESFVEPPTLVRIDPANGNTQELGTVNHDTLASIRFGRYESVEYPGANDVPIQMWVNYPPDFDPSKRWPVFLLLHGGPHNGMPNGFQWRWNAQVFAAQGYVVAWHNFHGSSGFGQAFTDSINPNQDILPYEDTIKAAQWFAAQDWVDSERMVAGGGSYGGYLASILLGREHPFKALIAHAAVYNWYTQVAADYGFQSARFGEFWENPGVFETSSPHFGARNFKTPTLVIHGQLDYRVPVNHGIELYHTLKKREVPAKLIYYPNENHWILKPQNSIFWYEQVHDWIKRYAAPGPL